MKRKYRAGAIGRTGGGRFGHGLHLSYRHLENVEMIAVADEDPAGRSQLEKRDRKGANRPPHVFSCPR